MFAVIAAVLFVVGLFDCNVGHNNYTFWLALGLAAWALHQSGYVDRFSNRNKHG